MNRSFIITFAPFNFVNAEDSPENTGISLSKHIR